MIYGTSTCGHGTVGTVGSNTLPIVSSAAVSGPPGPAERQHVNHIADLADRADQIIRAGEIAKRSLSCEPPDAELCRTVQRRARGEGLELEFERRLLDDASGVWFAKLNTPRGWAAFSPEVGQSWEELFQELALL